MRINNAGVLSSRFRAFWWACLLVAGVAFIPWHIFGSRATFPSDIYGWDVRVTCAASRAYAEGRDPYYVSNLHYAGARKNTGLSVAYLPFIVGLFRPVCGEAHALDDNFILVYSLTGGLIAFLLAAAPIARGRPPTEDILIRITVAICGFVGFQWVMMTGNIALFMGLFQALAVYCLCVEFQRTPDKNRLGGWGMMGALLLGFGISIKFYFAPLLFGLFLLPKSLKIKMLLLLIGLAGLIPPALLSFGLFQDIFPSFLKAYSGLIPNQHSPATEACDPSFYCLVKLQAMRRLPFSYAPVLFATNVLAALFVLAPFIAAMRRIFLRAATPGKNLLEKANRFLTDHPRFALHLTLFTLFTAVMLSPRVKEYGYFNACIFLALVISGLSHRRAIAASVVVVLVTLLTDGPRIFAQSVFHNYDQVIMALSTYAIVVASLKDSFEAMRRP